MSPDNAVSAIAGFTSAIIRRPLVVLPDTAVLDAIAQMSNAYAHYRHRHEPEDALDYLSGLADPYLYDLHLKARASCVVVADEGGVSGILTEQDVVRLTAQQQSLDRLVVHQVMTTPVATLPESAFTDMQTAMHRFQKHRTHHLLLVDAHNKLVGMVTSDSLQYVKSLANHYQQQQLEMECHQTETALRQSHAKNQALLAAMPDCMFRLGADGVYREFVTNKPEINILRPDLDPVGKRVIELTPTDIATRKLRHMEQVLRTGELRVYEQQIPVGDRQRDEEVRVVKSGEDEVLFIIRDISERKQAERQLIANENRFRNIFDHAGVGIIYGSLQGGQGRLLTCNPCFGAMLGYTVAELTQLTVADITHPEDRAIPELSRLLAGEITHFVMEKRYLRKNGTIMWANTTVSLLRDDAGAPLNTVVVVQDISEQKRLEVERQQAAASLTQLNQDLETKVDDRTAALQASETQLRTIMEAMPDLLLRVTKDGTCLESIQSRNLDGQFLPIQQHLSEVLPSELLQQQLQHIEQAIATGSLQVYEHHFHKCDRLMCEEVRISAIGPNEALIIVQDVTERRQTEAALRGSEQRFRSAIENAPFPVMIHADDGEILQINATWTELTGYTHQDIPTTQAWAEKAYGDRALEILETTIARKYTLGSRWDEGEFTLLTRDGRECIWSFSSAPLGQHSDGRHLVISMAADVTQRRQTELALQESKKKYRSIYMQTAVGLVNATLKGEFLEVNPRFCEMLGYSRQELLTKTIGDITHPDDQAQITRDMPRLFAGDIPYFFQEKRYLRKDGSDFWASTGVSIVRDAMGNPKHTLAVVQDISERKQAEMHLHEVSTRLNLAVESAGIGIWDWDIVNHNRVWNERMYALYGITPDSASHLGETWVNSLHPDDRATAQATTQKALQGQTNYDTEFRIIRPDGNTRFIKANALVQHNAQGEAERMIGINYDITTIRDAEVAMNRQLTMIEKAIDGIAILEGDTFLYLNQAHLTMFGYDHDELTGKTWHSLYSPEELERFEQQVFPSLGQNEAWQGEAIATRKDGSTFPEELSLSLSEDGFLICVCRDISDRKRAAAQIDSLLNRTQLLHRISSEIRNSLDLDIILQTSVQAIVTELPADVCTFAWYRRAESTNSWNIVKEQKIPELPSWLGSHSLDEFPHMLTHILQNQMYQVESLAALTTSVNNPLKSFFERMGISSYICLPIHTLGGKIGSLQIGRTSSEQPWQDDEIALLQDIGNQVAIAIYQAELYEDSQAKTKRLQQSYQDLQDAQFQLIQSEKMSSLGHLVAGIAHEINNPVSFIYGNLTPALDYTRILTQLIRQYQEAYPNPPESIATLSNQADIEYILNDFPKLLSSMENGATRIQDIVRSLGTFSRLDKSDFNAVNLHNNIDDTLVILQNRLNGRAGNPEIEVVKKYGDLPDVECYGSSLNQVFMNLLVNAIDAVEERQEIDGENYTGRITITTTASAQNVTISIKDNGIGMNQTTQTNIFNPFFTTKPIGKGTGMGLSISYQIVTGNHEGQLYCYSQPGEGTEFVIRLQQSHQNP